jgi:hypothetical protein
MPQWAEKCLAAAATFWSESQSKEKSRHQIFADGGTKETR